MFSLQKFELVKGFKMIDTPLRLVSIFVSRTEIETDQEGLERGGRLRRIFEPWSCGQRKGIEYFYNANESKKKFVHKNKNET
jgi:hypothetical protein